MPASQRLARAAARRSAGAPSGAATGARLPRQLRRKPGRLATPRGPSAAGGQAAGTRSSHRHDLANLDRPEERVRAPGGDLHGRVEMRCVDDEVAGDYLLALRERPVKHALPPLAGPDLLRFGDRAQRCSALEHAVGDQAHRVLTDLLHRQLALFIGRYKVRILGQDEHELHVTAPWSFLVYRSLIRHRREPAIDTVRTSFPLADVVPRPAGRCKRYGRVRVSRNPTMTMSRSAPMKIAASRICRSTRRLRGGGRGW